MSEFANSVLYYPGIEFADPRWLWTAALVWDKVYRIVPDGYTPEDCANVKRLCEDGDIGIPLHPGSYAKDIANEFIANIYDNKWQAAAFDKKKQVAEYARIHHDKMDVKIRELLISHGNAASHDKWLYVPTEFETLYMTFLARKMAIKNKLQAVSDSDAAWTAFTYYSTGDIMTEGPEEEQPFALASLIVGDYIPANITDITPEQLLKFRRQFPDERRHFMRAITDASRKLANCHDAQVAVETLRTIREDVNRALTDFRRSMDALKVESFVGLKTLSIPMTTSVLGKILGSGFEPTVLALGGLALGCIAGVASFQQKGQRLRRESDFSYLVDVERAFPKGTDRLNVPRELHYGLNEFIND